MAAIRRDLHAHPELSMQESETCAFITARLDDLGIETFRCGGTGVVGILRNGDGPTVAYRADTDGLPDAWERALIERDPTGRLRTLADVKPGDDLDGDGLTNLQEYLIGTYALDQLDGLALEVLAVENGRARLRFSTVPGRVYTVRSSTNLNDWNVQGFALAAAGDVNQTAYSGREVTSIEIWAPLAPEGTVFFRLYAE